MQDITPFGIRRTARTFAALGLRRLARAVHPDAPSPVEASGSVETPVTPPAEAASTGLPAHVRDAMDASDDAVAMALMAGLSGDMGPAIASRVQEARDNEGGGAVHDAVVEALHTIFDPEIPVDIYELGLIYGIDVRDDTTVGVRMTLTSPNCPAAQSLPAEVETKVSGVPGVSRADVEVVFEPAWTPDLMSEEAKLELNMM